MALALPLTGVCIRQPLPQTLLLSIVKPVGDTRNGNIPDEVKRIQLALNAVPPDQAPPDVPLVPDGLVGPLTLGAINKFQLKQFGFKDGRVDPNRQTIIRLNEIQARALHPDRIPKFVALLREALNVILAGQTNLLMAQAVVDTGGGGGLPSLGRAARMRLANLHFQADNAPIPRGTLTEALRIYGRMQQVFQRPGGIWGPAIFEVNYLPAMEAFAAYTTAGGFELGGQLAPPDPLRADRIYLCGVVDTGGREVTLMRIVHELAHFVGPVDGSNPIVDNGVGGVWIDAPQMVRLSPQQRLKTAQVYATFALDAAGIRPPGK